MKHHNTAQITDLNHFFKCHNLRIPANQNKSALFFFIFSVGFLYLSDYGIVRIKKIFTKLLTFQKKYARIKTNRGTIVPHKPIEKDIDKYIIIYYNIFETNHSAVPSRLRSYPKSKIPNEVNSWVLNATAYLCRRMCGCASACSGDVLWTSGLALVY